MLVKMRTWWVTRSQLDLERLQRPIPSAKLLGLEVTLQGDFCCKKLLADSLSFFTQVTSQQTTSAFFGVLNNFNGNEKMFKLDDACVPRVWWRTWYGQKWWHWQPYDVHHAPALLNCS